jgi:CheY-like chemotaxis protein
LALKIHGVEWLNEVKKSNNLYFLIFVNLIAGFNLMNILIAEDDYMIQTLMEICMSILEWEYTLVENGLQAVNTCKTANFDAIIMDIYMPVLNGIEASLQIREFNKVTPIIAVSSHVDYHTKIECAKAGINAFMAKPYTEDEIREAVTRLVRADS